MKKKSTFTTAGCILLLVILFSFRDEIIKKLLPDIGFAYIKVDSVTNKDANVFLNFQLENYTIPNLSIDSIHYSVAMEGITVFKSIDDEVDVQSKVMTIPLHVDFAKVDSIMTDLNKEDSDSIVLNIDIIAYTNYSLFSLDKIEYHHTKKTERIRLPKLVDSKVKLNKLGFKNTEVALFVDLRNLNSFPIEMKSLSFSVFSDKGTLVQNMQNPDIKIEGKSTAPIEIKVKVKPNQILRESFNYLLPKAEAKLNLNVNGIMILPIEELDPFPLNINTDITLEEILK